MPQSVPVGAVEVSSEALAPWSGRTVLITGGLGFIGSSMAHALLGAGAHVRLLDALLPLYGGNWRNVHGIENELSVLIADIRDGRTLADGLEGVDVVFHLAAQTSHVDSMHQPLLDADINVRGMLILLEALRTRAPGAVLVNVGTRAQYGAAGQHAILGEAGPFQPTDVYGASKHCAEQYALVYRRSYDMDVRAARVTNCYGPRHQMKHGRYGILNWFVRLALEDRPLPIYGRGDQQRDFLYIDDLVDALLRIGAHPAGSGRVYNVSSGCGIAFRSMAEQIVQLAGSGRVETVAWPEDRQRIETGDAVLDPAALETDTSWRPRTELADGLARTIAFYRREREYYWEPEASSAGPDR
ncbi:MAG: NAD(P)-dependent oxidoreductase [Acidobacteriota bacterium]|nr:MAG: NAD(P)-dependent oxidoreductase [Acidobacteriota bacterium]